MITKNMLNECLIFRFNKSAEDIRKDDNFNIWQAYSYLKSVCQLNDNIFDQEEYEKRISNIQDILNV